MEIIKMRQLKSKIRRGDISILEYIGDTDFSFEPNKKKVEITSKVRIKNLSNGKEEIIFVW